MATKVIADPDARLITIVEPPVFGLLELDVVDDIYEPLKDDWHSDASLQKLRFPFRTIGDPIGQASIGPYVFLNNTTGWRMQPYDADHEVNLKGNLIPESVVSGLSVPLWVSRPGRTIIIPSDRSAQALSIDSGSGSSLTQQNVRDAMGLSSTGGNPSVESQLNDIIQAIASGTLTSAQATQLSEIAKRLSLDPADPFTFTPNEMRSASGDIIIKITGNGKTSSTGTRQ